MDNRATYKKTTLIRNLIRVVKEISRLNLPVQIVAIYVFGGILREKERLHDLDLIVSYVMTPEQRAKWEKFQANFATHDLSGQRFPINELKKHLDPYHKKGEFAGRNSGDISIVGEVQIPPNRSPPMLFAFRKSF